MISAKALKEKEKDLTTKPTIPMNLKGKIKIVGPSCELDKDIVYCGRANTLGGWNLKKSMFANPFKVTEAETNETVCKKYEEYIRGNSELLSQLPFLVGKKLACWCVPNSCHTEVLIKLMKEKGLID